MAVTAHYFIEGARYFFGWVTNFRQPELTFEAGSISLTPILAMIVGAFLIIIVRKVLGVTKWSGPADSIYALQQSKVGVDVKSAWAPHWLHLFQPALELQLANTDLSSILAQRFLQ